MVAKPSEVKDQNPKSKKQVVTTQKTIKFKEQLMTITQQIRLRLYARASLFSDDPHKA
jgi:hypothetical protein